MMMHNKKESHNKYFQIHARKNLQKLLTRQCSILFPMSAATAPLPMMSRWDDQICCRCG